MYTFSKRIKVFALVLIILGAIGVIYGFMNSHKYQTVEDVKELIAQEAAHHGDSHEVADAHQAATTDAHATEASHAEAGDHHGASKEEQVLHQIHNRPLSALYVAAFFFFMIALGVLAFYAVQWAAQAGWSPVTFRVMEAITYYLLPGGLIVLAIAVFAGSDFFVWMKEGVTDPASENYDAIITGKSFWLNKAGFIIRGLVFIGGWSFYRYITRKLSIAQDTAEDNSNYKKTFKWSVFFLLFFVYTESMMAWDWIMSMTPHWYSTLFGWYVFASMFVSAITVIALMIIYLKSKGLMEFVNDSHLHDLAKFMFGISIFWTYLWFSQFMLIWYSNIPEEATYFMTRIEHYKLPFFGMVVMNFVFPLLILMNSDYKRIPWFVVMAGIVILCGHYLDVFNMIMPNTVGDRWSIGIPEIGSVMLFGGLFLLTVFYALSKAPLMPKRNPFIKESEQFHY